MELDAAGAEVEAAGRLLDRALGEIEPHERNEDALRALGGSECPVVRRPERGLAVRLVHAEGEGPPDSIPPEDGHEVVVGSDEPVDVPANVDVRVEDLRVLGDQSPQLVVVLGHEAARALDSLFHGT